MQKRLVSLLVLIAMVFTMTVIGTTAVSADTSGRSVSYSLRPLFEDDFTADEIPQSLFDLFLEQFKRPLSSTEMDKLCNWMKEYEQEFIICALREAVVYKKLNFNYIDKILVTWKANGKTLEELNGK